MCCTTTTSLAQWLRRPPRERKIRGSNPACNGIFTGSSHTSDLKIGAPVATLPGTWCYRVSAGTGWPGVSGHSGTTTAAAAVATTTAAAATTTTTSYIHTSTKTECGYLNGWIKNGHIRKKTHPNW